MHGSERVDVWISLAGLVRLLDVACVIAMVTELFKDSPDIKIVATTIISTIVLTSILVYMYNLMFNSTKTSK